MVLYIFIYREWCISFNTTYRLPAIWSMGYCKCLGCIRIINSTDLCNSTQALRSLSWKYISIFWGGHAQKGVLSQEVVYSWPHALVFCTAFPDVPFPAFLVLKTWGISYASWEQHKSCEETNTEYLLSRLHKHLTLRIFVPNFFLQDSLFNHFQTGELFRTLETKLNPPIKSGSQRVHSGASILN